MRDERKESYGSRTSELEFLLNKADTGILEDKPGDTAFVGQEELSKAFPNILTGNAFFDHALARLDSSPKFGAAVIRIDTPGDRDENDEQGITIDLCMDVARVIDTVCDNENGTWGRLGNDLFVCYFPEKSAVRCSEFAGDMREHLAKLRKETVTIGIAEYPTINFSKTHIRDNALKALDHAGFFGPDSTVSFDAVSLNISGDRLYQNGDIDGAVREFTTALMLDPSNINVRNSLGVCYGILGDYDKAQEEFENAAWLDPEEVMPVYNIGLISMLDGDKEKALEFFLQADSLDEDVFEVVFQIGRLYLETGKPEKGKSFLEKATLLKPDSGIAFRHLGDCFTVMEMTDAAVSAYKSSVRYNPNDADALSALGHLFELQGKNPEIAMMFCRQSVEISPENGLFRHRLGRLYLQDNMLDDALKEFKTASHLGFDSTQHIEEVENLMPDN